MVESDDATTRPPSACGGGGVVRTTTTDGSAVQCSAVQFDDGGEEGGMWTVDADETPVLLRG